MGDLLQAIFSNTSISFPIIIVLQLLLKYVPKQNIVRILSEATSIITPAWHGGQMVQVFIIEIVSIARGIFFQ